MKRDMKSSIFFHRLESTVLPSESQTGTWRLLPSMSKTSWKWAAKLLPVPFFRSWKLGSFKEFQSEVFQMGTRKSASFFLNPRHLATSDHHPWEDCLRLGRAGERKTTCTCSPWYPQAKHKLTQGFRINSHFHRIDATLTHCSVSQLNCLDVES